MSAATQSATQSATTAESNRFVAAHLAEATALGERLVDLVYDPDALIIALKHGFAALADPVYVDGIRSVTPGLGLVLGVRLPLLDAAHKAFKRGTRRTATCMVPMPSGTPIWQGAPSGEVARSTATSS